MTVFQSNYMYVNFITCPCAVASYSSVDVLHPLQLQTAFPPGRLHTEGASQGTPTHTHTSSPPPSPAPSLWLVCLPSLLLFGHRALSAHCKIVHVCFSLHFFFLSLHALLLSLPILPSTLSLSFSGYYIAKINTHCL